MLQDGRLASVKSDSLKLGGSIMISPEIEEGKPIELELVSIGKYGLAIGLAPLNYPLENGIGIDSLSWGIGGSG